MQTGNSIPSLHKYLEKVFLIVYIKFLVTKKVRAVIPRDIEPALLKAAALFRVVALGGPRQSGKTTLVRTTLRSIPMFLLKILIYGSMLSKIPVPF